MSSQSASIGDLQCTVTLETLAPSGESLKKVVYKNASLLLGRNEFRDIMLKLELGKRDFKYRLQDIQIHSKFAREGKATIKLVKHSMQFMLSNCPPDKLMLFLKGMTTKLACHEMGGHVVSARKRIMSDKPRMFEEISPLMIKELQTVHQLRAKAEEQKPDLFTPKAKGKRKQPLGQHNQQTLQYGVVKKPRLGGDKQTSGGLVAKSLVPTPVILTAEQKKVLNHVLSGKNIFFTGSAGTGKSFLMKRIIGALPPQHTFATASTGVAACHIGGTTLHAFAGIGSGRAPLPQCVELASRPQVAQQWKECRHLIIDEISMVDGDLFEKLEMIGRVIKQNKEPFGGIQLILCGDFLQLPPVTKRGEKRKFAFQSAAWNRCMGTNMELTSVRRQSDQKFINILQNIRVGKCTKDVTDALLATSKHSIDKDGILATRLCTHKEDVDHINNVHLNKLKEPTRFYESLDSDPGLAKTVNAMCPVSSKIELREGAQVMLGKNLDVQKGMVNGARGVVVGFENSAQAYPMVRFMCGETRTIMPERWSFKVPGGIFLSRRQLPLKLAWAISIHKSQGMSLDCVEISLSRVFESGQAYVALSRARSLEGLRVLDFSSHCVRADMNVLKFYKQIRHASRMEQTTMDSFI